MFMDNDDINMNGNNDDNVDEHQIVWPHDMDKRYASKVIRGESRLWAIPYRFGKRGAMPYRFGKRAAMPYRFGKRAAMHFRLGKKNFL
jgi:hypothetical protein